jgi:3-phenylpropionate/cinnamic acid dioxygenase small subunit
MVDFREVEQFIYREARLMDEHRYDDWLALWTEDATYWVPCGHDDADPELRVSIIYDRYPQLVNRLQRLKTGKAFAEDPPSRLCRLISNIETEAAAGGEIVARSSFVLGDLRKHQEVHWFGRTLHRLRKTDGELRIAYKKVILLNNDEPLPNLAFLI